MIKNCHVIAFFQCRSISLRISFTIAFFFFSLLPFYLRLNHHCGMLSFVTALSTYFQSTTKNGCVSDHMLS